MRDSSSDILVRDLPIAARVLYGAAQIVMHVLLLAVPLLLLSRARREPAHLKHLSHRFGFGPRIAPGAVWIYAASLGETRAASPLIAALRAKGHRVLLTHLSPAGMAEGARLFGQDGGVTQRYVPLDLFWAMRLFLRRYRPAMLIVMEIEIWPAMIVETVRRRVPVVMANGNLLTESITSRNALSRNVLHLYRLFSKIFTRTVAYKARYVSLGVPSARVHVVGDMKLDQLVDPAQVETGTQLRRGWTEGPEGAQRVLMLASTVEKEEAALLPMVTRLLAADEGLRVLWVPRSPQRFAAVAAALQAANVTVARRSELDLESVSLTAETRAQIGRAKVIVGDSLGEMYIYYPMADLVFVGASLVDDGGHNIIEPLTLGRPVVMGPSTFGIDFVAKPAAQAGAFESLPDAVALEARISALFSSAAELAAMKAAARAFVPQGDMPAEKTCDGIEDLLAGTGADGAT